MKDTRQRILDEALESLAQYGYQRTDVREVAAAAARFSEMLSCAIKREVARGRLSLGGWLDAERLSELLMAAASGLKRLRQAVTLLCDAFIEVCDPPHPTRRSAT